LPRRLPLVLLPWRLPLTLLRRLTRPLRLLILFALRLDLGKHQGKVQRRSVSRPEDDGRQDGARHEVFFCFGHQFPICFVEGSCNRDRNFELNDA
jgi:hypothetical protein